MQTAKTLIRRGGRPGWSESPWLIWVFAGRTCHFVGFVMLWLIFKKVRIFFQMHKCRSHTEYRDKSCEFHFLLKMLKTDNCNQCHCDLCCLINRAFRFRIISQIGMHTHYNIFKRRQCSEPVNNTIFQKLITCSTKPLLAIKCDTNQRTNRLFAFSVHHNHVHQCKNVSLQVEHDKNN